MYVEEVEAERLHAAEISSRPEGDVLVEMSATDVESCDARDVTQKEDGGTVATAIESVGDASSMSASASTPVLSVDSCSVSSSDSAEWSLVVNGTRYFGHLRPERRFVTDLEDMNDSGGRFPRETTKERNRRLLIQDRVNQARLDKARRSRRVSKCSKQVELLRTIKEERLPGKGDRDESGGRGVRDDDIAVVDDSSSHLRRREIEAILRRKFRLFGVTGKAKRRFRKRVKQGRVKRTRWFGRCNTARQRVAGIIMLYSSSASRHAMFRSNRRFKPGD